MDAREQIEKAMKEAGERMCEKLQWLAKTLPGATDAKSFPKREDVARFAYYQAERIIRHEFGMPDLPPRE